MDRDFLRQLYMFKEKSTALTSRSPGYLRSRLILEEVTNQRQQLAQFSPRKNHNRCKTSQNRWDDECQFLEPSEIITPRKLKLKPRKASITKTFTFQEMKTTLKMQHQELQNQQRDINAIRNYALKSKPPSYIAALFFKANAF